VGTVIELLMALGVTPQHLGALHAYEKALVALIAFGPFVVLFFVVYVIRKRDLAAERGDDDSASEDPRGT
jgi:hypothetical protein